MQSTEKETGGVAQEPTAEPARATESESDGERVSETGSSMGSAKKMPNSWNLVLKKFCASKTEEDIKGLEEARDNFLEEHAKEFGLLDYPFGDASSRLYGFHYKEKPRRNQRSFILYCPYRYRAGCPFQLRYKLTPSEIRIWEKREHDHSRDHSKTIPVAAAKQIKATMKLAPVGQRASKLHRELNRSPVTRVSPTKSKVRAIQRLVRATNMDKIIEMHGIELDNTYNSVRQVRLACIVTYNFQFSGPFL